MQAITITQPWATLMAAGVKHIETRSWPPSGLHMGERVAIHAGKGLADLTIREWVTICASHPFREAIIAAWRAGLITPGEEGRLCANDLPRGCVVAIAEFFTAYRTEEDACDRAIARSMAQGGAPHERVFSNFRPGRWAWIFPRVHPLTPPIPALGQRGLWTWTPPAALDGLLALHARPHGGTDGG